MLKKLLCFIFTAVIFCCGFCDAEALKYNGSYSFKNSQYYKRLCEVNLSKNQRKDIVNVALSQLGYNEGNSPYELDGNTKGTENFTEYGRWYGTQDMWCGMFVSWCARVSGISTEVIPSHAFTPCSVEFFIKENRAYTPKELTAQGLYIQQGDLVYFKTARNNNIVNHVGIAVLSFGKILVTVEGNTLSSDGTHEGVHAKIRLLPHPEIAYICKPEYR